MKKSIAYLLIALATAALSDCTFHLPDSPKPANELDKLPPITRTGRSTFGCLVNGKAWVGNTGYGDYMAGRVSIFGDRPSEEIALILVERNSIGITTASYPLNAYPDVYPDVVLLTGIYQDSTCYAGSIVISRFDLKAQILSGTFYLNVAKKGYDTLRVTDGRFDIVFDY